MKSRLFTRFAAALAAAKKLSNDLLSCLPSALRPERLG